MRGRRTHLILLLASTQWLVGCNASSSPADEMSEDDTNEGGSAGATDPEAIDPSCAGEPEVVPPEVPYLINIGRQSYIVGPEGGEFDLTDEPAVTISVAPCTVYEPVRFTYGIQRNNPGTGAEGASVFISFLTIKAEKAGNSGHVDFGSGDVSIIWHDAPAPSQARIWAMGLRGYEELSTTVENGDVRASTPNVSYLGFALGE